MPNELWQNFSEEELREIVANSKTYKKILEQIGYKTYSPNNQKVRDFCNFYHIDYSHLTEGKKENLVGQQFGDMKVISEDLNKNGTKSKSAYWFCECQACEEHTIKSICAANLKRGTVTNCGCQKTKRIIKYNHNNFQDLSNQVFGFLTVIEPIFDGENFTNKYRCRCECGREIIVFRNNLKEGSTKSCGCKKMSLGEINTERALQYLNILYQKQYSFKDLIGSSKQLSFDFAIFKNNQVIGLIECQGRQHYEPIDIFGGEEQFIIQAQYDEKKREYCKKHQIKLYEIPYKDYNIIDANYIINLIGSQIELN